jgi:dUTP pyrophosphatase
MVDKCICCGAVIPEGSQVCQNCKVASGSARKASIQKANKNTIKVVLDEGAKMPTRAHDWDAGLDLYSRDYCTLWANDSAKFDTGVHVEIPEGYYGEIRSRSGLMCNHDIVTDGTIDAHYTGSITVKLFNNGKKAYRVHEGEKIAQLVIVPCLIPEIEVVDELSPTDRGDGGFGSTGKF